MTFMCVCVCGQGYELECKARTHTEEKRLITWDKQGTFTAYNMKLYATNMELNKIKCNMKLE